MKNNILKLSKFLNIHQATENNENIIDIAKAYKKAFDSYKINGDKYYYTRESKDSIAQIYRYIKLLNLIPELQELVIENKIIVSVAIILSDFSIINQNIIYNFITKNPDIKITIKKIKDLKKYEENNVLSPETLNRILNNKFSGKLKKETIKKLSTIFVNDDEFNEFIESFIKIKI